MKTSWEIDKSGKRKKENIYYLQQLCCYDDNWSCSISYSIVCFIDSMQPTELDSPMYIQITIEGNVISPLSHVSLAMLI